MSAFFVQCRFQATYSHSQETSQMLDEIHLCHGFDAPGTQRGFGDVKEDRQDAVHAVLPELMDVPFHFGTGDGKMLRLIYATQIKNNETKGE